MKGSSPCTGEAREPMIPLTPAAHLVPDLPTYLLVEETVQNSHQQALQRGVVRAAARPGGEQVVLGGRAAPGRS